jgi:hypothetical protein
VARLRERSLDCRIEIRSSGGDREEVVLLRALDRAEEVRPVRHDGPAEARAELVPAIVRLALLEVVLRVQALVAEILERVAVKLVRARLGHDGDEAAGGESVLGLVLHRVHLELADRVLRKVLPRLALLGPGVGDPVGHEGVAVEGAAGADVHVVLEHANCVLTGPPISSARFRY